MGLDCSHDAWHGAYSAFMRWRKEIARAAGLPPLEFMDGFWDRADAVREFNAKWSSPAEGPIGMPSLKDCADPRLWTVIRAAGDLPIRWSALRPDPLHVLLHHSDCGGALEPECLPALADRLEELLPLLEGDGGGHVGLYRHKTRQFIAGCRRAAAAGERLLFR